MVGGVIVVGENKELGDQMAFLQNAVGAIAGPVRQFSRPARIEDARACGWSGIAKTRWRSRAGSRRNRKSSRCVIPGLERHPQHELAKKQMRGFGGMVTIVLKTDLAGTRRFLENTHLFSLAESLGGVESLINHPALMTHGVDPAGAARSRSASPIRSLGCRSAWKTSRI